MARSAASLMVEFGSSGADKVLGDIERLGKGVASAGEKEGFLRGALSTGAGVLGANLFQSAITGVMGLGKAMLMANADAEQYRNQLETVTGSQERAAAVFKNLQQFAKATPFEFPELVQSAINLESFGMKADDWMTTIGNTAAATGKSVDQVTQAVMDASTGEFERLKELGVKASVEGDKVRFRYMQNGREMVREADRNSAEMIEATLKGIWNEKYDGAMARQARTFKGQLSTLKDNVNMTMQAASKGIFEFARSGLAHANLFFDRFNRLRERGLSPFQAGLTALKWTLQDVFGKSTGNAIYGVFDGIARGGARALRTIKSFGAGVLSLGKYLHLAFIDGDAWNDWLTHLPQPLQRAAHALGSLADAVGDVWRSFRAGGLGAAWETLTSGGELGQMRAAFGALGDEAWGALKAGFDAINWGAVWDTAISDIGTAASAGYKIANVGIEAGIDLAGDIADATKDLYGWVKSKLFGGPAGDGTGGPEPYGDMTPITIADVVIEAGARLGGQIAEIAGNLQGWLQQQVTGGSYFAGGGIGVVPGSGFTVTLAQIAIEVLDSVIQGLSYDSVKANLQTNIDQLGEIKTQLDAWSIALTGSPAISFGGGGGTGGAAGGTGNGLNLNFIQEINDKVQAFADKINGEHGWAIDATNWLFRITGNPQMQADDISGWSTNLAAVVQVAVHGIDYGPIVRDISDDIAGAFNRGGNAIASIASAIGGWISGAFDAVFGGGEAYFVGGGVGVVGGGIGGYSSVITDALQGIFEDAWGAFTMPELPDFLSPITSKLDGLLTALAGYVEKFQAVWRRINDAISGGGDPAGGLGTKRQHDPGTGGGQGGPTGGGLSVSGAGMGGGGGGAGYGGGFDGATPFMVTPKLDTAALDSILATVSKSLGTLSQTAQKIKLDADVSGVDAALTTLRAQLDALSLTSFTAKLALDTSLADAALMTARAAGDAYALTTWTATIAANNGPALAAIAAAARQGFIWENTTFTARFAIDTSGLDAAMRKADEAAKYISDRMPHSPAKVGPLSRPIRFDYIADAMGSAMRRVGLYAGQGAAAVAGALAPVALGAGLAMSPALAATATAPRHQGDTFVIQQVTPDELVKLMRDARAGARVAGRLGPTLQARKNRTVW